MAPARVLFIVTQIFTFLLGIVGVATAYISLFTDLNVFVDFIPSEIFQGTGMLSAGVTFVSAIGLGMVICQLDTCFIAFVVLSLLQVCFNIGFFVIVILFRNGKSTIPLFDDVLNERIINFEANALNVALDDPDGFITVQNLLDCCGINMETRFNANDTFALVFSGDKCFDEVDIEGVVSTGNDEMLEIMTQPGIDLETALLNASENAILSDPDFFCEQELSELAENSLGLVNAILGVVIVFEMISLLCSILIYCCVERDEEGKLDFDNAQKMNRVIVKVTKNVQEPFRAGYARFNSFSDKKSVLGLNRGGTLEDSFANLEGSNQSVNEEKKIEGETNARSSFIKGAGGMFQSGVMSLIAPFATSSAKLRQQKKASEEDEVGSEVETLPPPKQDTNIF